MQAVLAFTYLKQTGPNIDYIPGPCIIVTDALSRIYLHSVAPSNTFQELMHFDNGTIELPSDAFPLRFKTIDKAQQQDKTIHELLTKDTSGVALTSFHGGGKHHDLVCNND